MANLEALYHDRIQVVSTDTGTGALAIDAAAVGFLPLPSDTFYYVIEHENGTEWEIGFGDGFVSGELNRATVIASSNADELVNFTTGSKRIFTSVPAEFFAELRKSLFIKQGRPSGEGGVFTSGSAPEITSIDFFPPLKSSGGLSHLIASYTVAANAPGPHHRKLWEGTIVILDGVLQSDTPTVVADPDTRPWDFTIAWDSGSGGFLNFEVTGEDGVYVGWRIAVEVRDHDENGA